MPVDTAPALVVGAAGRFAGLVIPQLAQRGMQVRALIRHKDQADLVTARGASEVAVGDLTDPPSLREALSGVRRVFYVAPAFMEREAEIGIRFVGLAREAGVERIVFSSVVHPILSSLINHAAKAPVEEAILDSGMQYTFLHPVLFFQMFEDSWPQVVSSGVIAEPWSSDTRFSRVDYREVAEAAAMALQEDRLLNGTFELASPGSSNRHDVAALISDITGTKITAERIDPESLGNVPPAMRAMFAHYDHTGLLGNSLTLEAILGRAPTTLREFFTELADR